MTPGQPLWNCCLPTADETTLSLSCPVPASGPWLSAVALRALREAAEVAPDPNRERYAVGRGPAAPQILGEPIRWGAAEAVLEVHQPSGQEVAQLTLRLPPWDLLSAALAEAEVWDGLDRVAEAVRADCGAVDDGRSVGFPPGESERRWARDLLAAHLGALLPSRWLAHLPPGTNPYLELRRSGLLLVLR
ncbi:MAG: hypothetical protein WBU92_08335 [Candidatus Dormiibacterota bacterium]